MKDILCGSDDVIRRDFSITCPFTRLKFTQFGVHAKQVSPFTGDDKHAAIVRRLDSRLESDVREVGYRQHVGDTPEFVRRIATKLNADRCAHRTARTVAANHVAGSHDLNMPLMARVHAL